MEEYIFTPYTSPKKLANLFLAFLENIFKPEVARAKPIKLVVDVTNFCNLRCPLCPTGRRDKARSRGFMDFEKFKKIFDELAPYLLVVDFYNWGEPLLHKEICKFVSYAHSKKVRTRISTNLTVLPDDVAVCLLKSGLDVLFASIDGVSADTYKKYRIGGDFDKVMENLRKLVRFKRELGAKTKIIWQFIVFKHNIDEVKKLYKEAREVGVDGVKLVPSRIDMGYENFFSKSEKLAVFSDWLPGGKFSRYIAGGPLLEPKTCLFLWTHAVINWNGSVSGCCGVWPEKFDFGNAFEEGSFLKIWNGKNFRKARWIVKKKIPYSNMVCSNCVRNGFIAP